MKVRLLYYSKFQFQALDRSFSTVLLLYVSQLQVYMCLLKFHCCTIMCYIEIVHMLMLFVGYVPVCPFPHLWKLQCCDYLRFRHRSMNMINVSVVFFVYSSARDSEMLNLWSSGFCIFMLYVWNFRLFQKGQLVSIIHTSFTHQHKKPQHWWNIHGRAVILKWKKKQKKLVVYYSLWLKNVNVFYVIVCFSSGHRNVDLKYLQLPTCDVIFQSSRVYVYESVFA